jgi:hypothetical protein
MCVMMKSCLLDTSYFGEIVELVNGAVVFCLP